MDSKNLNGYPLVWTREQITKLVLLGRSGASWTSIGRDLKICSTEAARRKWNDISDEEDREQRVLSKLASKDLAEMVTMTQERLANGFTEMPVSVKFSDDSRAIRADYGRAPMPETWVPYKSGTAWAVR